jgi:MFS family permease
VNTSANIRWRLFVMMILEIGIWGSWQIKIFPYMGMLGFTPLQQGWVGSVFGIATVIGIFFSNQFADRNFAAERFLAFSHFVGGAALIATAFVSSFPAFFALFLIYGLLYVPTLSVTNSLAFAHLRNPSGEFGFVRMGGTVGWIIVSWPFIFLLGDHAGAMETRWIFVVAGVLSLVLAGYSLTLPHTPPRTDMTGTDRLAWVRTAKFIAQPQVFILFLVVLIDAVVHNGYFVLIDGFLTQVGISARMTMVVSSIGQGAEIIAMLILGTVLAKLGWKWTMIIGVLGHAIRYGTFALFGTSEYQWLVILIQLMHGICYAFFFATVYIYVDKVFPADVRSTAQGAANVLILGGGMFFASQLFPQLAARFTIIDSVGVAAVDYSRLFAIPTAMAIVGILILAIFFKPPTARPGDSTPAAS